MEFFLASRLCFSRKLVTFHDGPFQAVFFFSRLRLLPLHGRQPSSRFSAHPVPRSSSASWTFPSKLFFPASTPFQCTLLPPANFRDISVFLEKVLFTVFLRAKVSVRVLCFFFQFLSGDRFSQDFRRNSPLFVAPGVSLFQKKPLFLFWPPFLFQFPFCPKVVPQEAPFAGPSFPFPRLDVKSATSLGPALAAWTFLARHFPPGPSFDTLTFP